MSRVWPALWSISTTSWMSKKPGYKDLKALREGCWKSCWSWSHLQNMLAFHRSLHGLNSRAHILTPDLTSIPTVPCTCLKPKRQPFTSLGYEAIPFWSLLSLWGKPLQPCSPSLYTLSPDDFAGRCILEHRQEQLSFYLCKPSEASWRTGLLRVRGFFVQNAYPFEDKQSRENSGASQFKPFATIIWRWRNCAATSRKVFSGLLAFAYSCFRTSHLGS